MAGHDVALWAVGDVAGLGSGELARHRAAVSFALAMDPDVMAGAAQGPTPEYARLYGETNLRLDTITRQAAELLSAAGFAARAVPSSVRSDPVNIKGEFPHKTAATLAGLGWVGRNCQLITRSLGPWLRLGTVLTDCPLPVAQPVERHYCGDCRACVEACPAGALAGGDWRPGVDRGELLDARACDAYKKAHFMDYNHGHNCGICTAACPWGQKTLTRGQG